MPAPVRPAVLCAATMLAWTIMIVLHALALQRDALQQDAGARLVQSLLVVAPSALTLAAGSALLGVAYLRRGDALLRSHLVILTAILFFALMLPVSAIVAAATQLLASGRPLSDLVQQVAGRDAFGWWVDACLAVLAVLSQTAFAAWRRSQSTLVERELARADSAALRLRLLQGQLKPHFLFNALNSISALVRTAEREQACTALEQLGDLLRHVLHASRHEWLSVAHETDFIQAYLELQLLRFGDRLSVDCTIDRAAHFEVVACPPMLFQPLVENAIHHGVERHHRACTIRITLARAGDNVILTIDNPMPAAGESIAGHGIGLAATRERLAILYGDRAALTVAARGDIHHTHLTFPAQRWHDHDD